jgi:3-(methylthio)propanoyl-CoA dehydrogenase
MNTYYSDLESLYFELFDVLRVEMHAPDMEVNDLKEVIKEYHKFTANKVFPCRREGDEQGVHLKDGQVTVPESFKTSIKEYHDNGWFALGLPAEIEGTEVPEAIHMACRSLSVGANTAWSMYSGLSKAALNVILKVGSDEQKAKYLKPMMEGRFGGTMCLSEAGAGSDIGNTKTTATWQKGGFYKIKGTKVFISSGDNNVYENVLHLVLARTQSDKLGTKGLSLFLVPKYRVNDDGSLGDANDVVCTKVEEKMGIHASATCVMNFGDGDNCNGYLIGKEFDGMNNMFIMMNEARLLCGIQGESQANLAYLAALNYAKERIQFNVEIINQPDVRRMLLRMRSMGSAMRALSLYTSNLFDISKKNPENQPLIDLMTPICKAYCSDYGFLVCAEAVQVYGGYGYCSEYGIEQFVRDSKIATIYEGTNGIQAQDFVSRKVLKDSGYGVSVILMRARKALNDKYVRKHLTHESRILSDAINLSHDVLKHYTALAQNNDFNKIQQGAYDFLIFSGHIFCSWRLIKSAAVASKKLDEEKDSLDKAQAAMLKAKVEDAKVFIHYYLGQGIALGKNILSPQLNYDLINM